MLIVTRTPADFDVLLVVPANSSLPTIGGDPNGTLVATTGTWNGSPSPTFAYQWKRDGVNIAGATSSSYTTTVGDDGAAITVEVTGTNSEGSATAESAAVYPNPSITADDDTLTADNDTITVDRD